MSLNQNAFYPLQRGSDIYYSHLFLPEETRDATFTLYEFCNNLQDIIRKSKDKEMTRIKLRWWEEDIHKLYDNKGEHPLSKALFPVVKKFNLPKPLLEEYYQGIMLKLDMDHLCTEEDQVLFAYREMGLPHMLNQYIIGFSEHNILQAVHHFSVTIAMVNLLAHLNDYITLGKMPIPLEDFDKATLSMEELLSDKSLDLDNTFSLFSIQAERARKYYDKGMNLITAENTLDLQPLLLQSRLALKLLGILEEEKFPVLRKQISLTPLRKFFFVWREKRKPFKS